MNTTVGDRGKGRRRGQRQMSAHEASAPAARRDSYLSLTTRPGESATTPIFPASHRAGEAPPIGTDKAAAPAVPALAPILPAGLSGLDIRETLHRFDANVQLATRERGVLGINRVGEPLATIAMRWRPVPDGFDATPSAVAPDMEMSADGSQRFVVQEGTLTFEDRGRSAVRFFGAGRTYPATTDGHARLLFAATAVVVEGTGGLKGARGTLTLSGEVTRPSIVSLSIVGRFDAASPVTLADSLGPLRGSTGPDLPATVLTLVGDTDAAGVEHVRVARIGNDLASAGHLRSLLRVGATVGGVRGRLPFDPADPRCAIPLMNASRVLTFTDPAGVPVGSITAPTLDGTAFRDAREGRTVDRLTAYGPATHGTGALAGAGGMLTLEAAVGAGGAMTTVYTLRLEDPHGRFRASYADAYAPIPAMKAVDLPPEPAAFESLTFVDGPAGYMSAADRAILRHADRALADGVELMTWWEARDRAKAYAETFDIVGDRSHGARGFGFFDTATVAGASLPVMGVFQEMFYDRQNAAKGDAVRDQVKEFVLKYFLGANHLRESGAGVRVAYRPLYYRQRGTAEIGRFLADQGPAVVDLRHLGTVYDWILLEVDAFDFNVPFAPLGSGAPILQMPLKRSTYVVLGPPFIRNEDGPAPGVGGRYGFSYAFVPYTPGGRGLIAYGPGHFATAIQQVEFTVRADGEIRARTAFVAHRPKRISQVDLDPIDWGFRLADRMTFGAASGVMRPVKAIADTLPLRVRGLDPLSTWVWMADAIANGMGGRRPGDSKAMLEKRMLVQHSTRNYERLIDSLLVWRMVPDWRDHERVPAFFREAAC